MAHAGVGGGLWAIVLQIPIMVASYVSAIGARAVHFFGMVFGYLSSSCTEKLGHLRRRTVDSCELRERSVMVCLLMVSGSLSISVLNLMV